MREAHVVGKSAVAMLSLTASLKDRGFPDSDFEGSWIFPLSGVVVSYCWKGQWFV